MAPTTQIRSMQELAELATLDAYGLLDEADLFRLEQAMLQSPSEVRARVRAIQDEIAADEQLLPDCAPSDDLRQRVLSRVQAAVDLHYVTASNQLVPPSALDNHSLSFARHSMRSVWTWRMAALILLGACVALVVVKERQQQHFDRVIREAISLQADAQVKDGLGDSYTTFVALMERPDVRHIYLVGPNGDGTVRLSIDEQTGQMYAFGMDLAGHGQACSLELRDQDGQIVTSEAFPADRYITGIAVQVDPAKLANLTAFLIGGSGDVLAKAPLRA
jgi:hypothetical protein